MELRKIKKYNTLLSVRIFKDKRFSHWAAKAQITDDQLRTAASEIENGQAEANLGGDVYKKRIAMQGQGKRGSYRTIVIFRRNERLFFMFGYAKTEMSDIGESAERGFKRLAKKYLAYTDAQLDLAVKTGELLEITGGNE
jgi:hypothetical protein